MPTSGRSGWPATSGSTPPPSRGWPAASADWIVTMDEDGQHDPAAIGAMLDTALASASPLVYAAPTNTAPHTAFRNVLQRRGPRRRADTWRGRPAALPQLPAGARGGRSAAWRPTAARASTWTWPSRGSSTARRVCPVRMREERGRRSGYRGGASPRTSGVWCSPPGRDPLRMVAVFGALLEPGRPGGCSPGCWSRSGPSQVPVAGLDVGDGGPAGRRPAPSSSRSEWSPSTSGSPPRARWASRCTSSSATRPTGRWGVRSFQRRRRPPVRRSPSHAPTGDEPAALLGHRCRRPPGSSRH